MTDERSKTSTSGIGERVRRLRRARGLTQAQVAGDVMTPPYLSLIEAGKREPSSEIIDHLARVLDVDPRELATGRPAGLQADLELRLQRARLDLHQGRTGDAETAVQAVVDEARAADLPRVLARSLTVLASTRRNSGDVPGARALLEEALSVWRDQPTHLRFETVANFAVLLLATGEARYAVHVLESYLLELDRAGLADPVARMRIHSALVACFRELGMRREANAAVETALKLAPRVDDPEHLACMNMNVAVVLQDQGRHDDALDVLRRAEEYFHDLDWSLSVARSRWNRGVVAADKGRYEEARESLTAALDALGQAGAPMQQRANLLNEMGRLERLAGDTDRAIPLLRRARADLSPVDAVDQGINARELGLCLAVTDPEAATAELRRAAEHFAAAGHRHERAATLQDLGHLYRTRGMLDEAVAALDEGLQLSLEAEGPR